MKGWLQRLRSGLSRTREALTQRIQDLVSSWKGTDPQQLEALEEILITGDLGVSVTQRLLDRIQREAPRDPQGVWTCLREGLLEILEKAKVPSPGLEDHPRPHVILVVGVNGTGKTTTIGKLAWAFRQEGKRVLLAAGDTFRAAAIEQLVLWGERVGAEVIRHQSGADPAAVAYDALAAARARGIDVLLVDTAGRLHTRKNLMEELKKIHRVLGKDHPGSPHEVFLVLDATTGQNALQQARLFHEALGITGLVLTKLDGTARGGVVVAIVEALGIPVRYIGVGEGLEDLQPFNPKAFVDGLLPA